jgi:hypothetical protein
MQIVCDLLETGGWVLVAGLVEEIDLDVPFLHREPFHLRWLVTEDLH